MVLPELESYLTSTQKKKFTFCIFQYSCQKCYRLISTSYNEETCFYLDYLDRIMMMIVGWTTRHMTSSTTKLPYKAAEFLFKYMKKKWWSSQFSERSRGLSKNQSDCRKMQENRMNCPPNFCRYHVVTF